MELLQFNIAAGETKHFERAGRYFEIISAQSLLNVHFEDAAGSRAESLKLALSGFFAEGGFSSFEVENPTAAKQSVQVLISDGRGGSRRQPGVVSVVDGGRQRTIDGVAFMGATSLTAAAGQWPVLQLLNPAGSGKRLVVKRVTMGSDIATVCRVGRLVAPAGGAAIELRSKLIAAALAMAGKIYRDPAAAIPAAFEQFFAINTAASAQVVYAFEEPLVIAAGEGVAVVGNSGVQTASVLFEGYEEAVA